MVSAQGLNLRQPSEITEYRSDHRETRQRLATGAS
jgi:hypothetical protein